MGRYTTVNEVEKYIGKAQLIWLSQPNREDSVTIDRAAVDDSIAVAEQEIDDRLFSAMYRVPLQGLNGASDLVVIRRIAIKLAVYDMATGRQVADPTQVEKYEEMYKESQDQLQGYADGSRTLQAIKWRSDQSNSPTVINSNRSRVIRFPHRGRC